MGMSHFQIQVNPIAAAQTCRMKEPSPSPQLSLKDEDYECWRKRGSSGPHPHLPDGRTMLEPLSLSWASSVLCVQQSGHMRIDQCERRMWRLGKSDLRHSTPSKQSAGKARTHSVTYIDFSGVFQECCGLNRILKTLLIVPVGKCVLTFNSGCLEDISTCHDSRRIPRNFAVWCQRGSSTLFSRRLHRVRTHGGYEHSFLSLRRRGIF